MKIRKAEKTEAGTGEITKEYAEQTFKELLAFQGYGFCKAHAASYSVYSAVQMWLQEHYFDEYMCALLRHVDRAKEKKGVGVLNERVEYCVRHGMSVHYPDVMSSTDKWELTPGGLLAPLKNIKGFSDREVRTIVDGRPYRDLPDFLDRTKFNKNRFEALLFSHALRRFGSIPDLYEYYYNVYAVKDSRPAKKEQSVDLFAMFGDEPEQQEESSAAPRVQFPYNSGDIDEKCLDYNGFVIPTNVRAKYHEFFERGMKKVAELKHDDSYNNKRNRICTLEEASDPQQRKDDEVKKDGYMSRWILAKVVKVARNIPGKWGTFSKMTVSDGYDSKDIFCNSSLSSRLKKGVVAVMPVSVSKETGRMYFDSHTNDNHELVILEEPQ